MVAPLFLITAEMFCSGISFGDNSCFVSHENFNAVFYLELICSKSFQFHVIRENAVNDYYSYVLSFPFFPSLSFSFHIPGVVSNFTLQITAFATFSLSFQAKRFFCFRCLFNLMVVVVRKTLHYEIVQKLMSLRRTNNRLRVYHSATVLFFV